MCNCEMFIHDGGCFFSMTFMSSQPQSPWSNPGLCVSLKGKWLIPCRDLPVASLKLYPLHHNRMELTFITLFSAISRTEYSLLHFNLLITLFCF